MAEVTIIFADLSGSTGLFESMGNVKAAQIVTKLTQWIGELCVAHSGRVIKYLGDGVLVAFTHSEAAMESVTDMQRLYSERLQTWPDKLRMKLKVGVARGEVVEQDGDCYGDAVNVASRLSDLCGPEQILVSESVINELPADNAFRFRNLGPMSIRGRTEPCVVYRVEWQREMLSAFMTAPADLDSLLSKSMVMPSVIVLTWLDVTATFKASDLPIYLGRVSDMQFVVNDPRVSRLHAKIDRRGDMFVLEDVSSYGTWVRFTGRDAVIALRREECVLLDEGEMALGASFDDFSVPTIGFKFRAAAAPSGQGLMRL